MLGKANRSRHGAIINKLGYIPGDFGILQHSPSNPVISRYSKGTPEGKAVNWDWEREFIFYQAKGGTAKPSSVHV